jgi:hypothetical protein
MAHHARWFRGAEIFCDPTGAAFIERPAGGYLLSARRRGAGVVVLMARLVPGQRHTGWPAGCDPVAGKAADAPGALP